MNRDLIDPDMPAQELLLHMGEMTAQEMRTARAAIRWANSRLAAVLEASASEGERRGLEMGAIASALCSLAEEIKRDGTSSQIGSAEELVILARRIRSLIPEAPAREGE